MTYTLFNDMHSGGGRKLSHELILIEASSEDSAIEIFEHKFNRSPHNVTCSCCGQDYYVSTYETIEEALSYHITHWSECDTVKEFEENGHVLIIKGE